MSVTVEAMFFDRQQVMNSDGLYTSADVPYLVRGATDETEALAAAYSQIAIVFEGIQLDTIEIDERVNQTQYKVLARYSTEKTSNPGGTIPEPTFSFDTTGGTRHITQSRSTRASYPAGAPDYKGAIGVAGNSSNRTVEGTDIVIPQMTFSETHYLPPAVVTTSFRATLCRLTGSVNQEVFRSFNAGEVLFLGATGTRQGDDSFSLWEVTYRFGVSGNRESFNVGDVPVTEKKGWDYLWVQYADSVSGTNVLKTPKYVFIEKVYPESDFTELGIGS